MKTRLIVAGILIAIALPIVLIGGTYLTVFLTVAIAIGIYEAVFARSESKKWPLGLKLFCLITPLLMIYWGTIVNFSYNLAYDQSNPIIQPLQSISVPTLGIATLLIVLFLAVILDSNVEVADATYLFTMIILLTLAGKAILYITLKSDTFKERLLPIFFVTFVTYMTDSGGYFIGRFFGKHKINPRISPKKTYEGMAGACIFGLLTTLFFCIPYFRLPSFDGKSYNIFLTLIIGILLTAGAQIGDFLFSAIKRFYKIKDFGTLLPGHGGILDRIDSLIINCILFVIFDSVVVRSVAGEQDLIVFLLGLF